MFFTNVSGTGTKKFLLWCLSIGEREICTQGRQIWRSCYKICNMLIYVYFFFHAVSTSTFCPDVDLINCYDDEDSGKGSDILIHPFLLVVFSYVFFAFVITLTVVV